MALNGIGASGGSPLEKFQQARELARRKLETADRPQEDSRVRLAELLQRKQAEIGGLGGKPSPNGAAAAAQALSGSRSRPVSSFAGASPAEAKAPGQGAADAVGGVSGAYGRAGATEKPDPKPRLGRYVDFMA